MERQDFINTTQNLCDLYGKSLNATQAEFWYTSLQSYDAQLYRKAVGDYVRNNKYMPTISDILGQIKKTAEIEATRAQKETKLEDIKVVPCDRCHGSGLIKYTKDKLYDYLCTCQCENGKRQKAGYPFLLSYNEVFPHVENEFHIPASAPLDYDLSQIKF